MKSEDSNYSGVGSHGKFRDKAAARPTSKTPRPKLHAIVIARVRRIIPKSIMADSQRVELAASRTQVEAMKVSVDDYARAVRTTEERLARERSEVGAAGSAKLFDASRINL